MVRRETLRRKFALKHSSPLERRTVPHRGGGPALISPTILSPADHYLARASIRSLSAGTTKDCSAVGRLNDVRAACVCWLSSK
jgi:hypothetical protein